MEEAVAGMRRLGQLLSDTGYSVSFSELEEPVDERPWWRRTLSRVWESAKSEWTKERILYGPPSET